MDTPIYTIDAFTHGPCLGNPAGVCPLPRSDWPSETWMQRVALEMNLSETAFLLPALTPGGPRPIRYFTPTTEVALCGHATLGSAHALWAHTDAPRDQPLVFKTCKEEHTLTCQRLNDGVIAMQFPADTPEDCELPAGLLEALSLRPEQVQRAVAGRFDVVLQLADADAVLAVEPDFAALSHVPARGIAVTAIGGALPGQTPDFTSRFFAPAFGIDEDPVTGSLHCLLGPFWAQQLGRSELLAYQASKRGGVLQLRVQPDSVEIRGQAQSTVIGQWIGEPAY